MLQLSVEQRLHLYGFILGRREHSKSSDTHLEQTLGYIMSNVDVRKPEKIMDESIRELVRCAFELMKNDYLFENRLITPSSHQETISKAQARLKDSFPELRT